MSRFAGTNAGISETEWRRQTQIRDVSREAIKVQEPAMERKKRFKRVKLPCGNYGYIEA